MLKLSTETMLFLMTKQAGEVENPNVLNKEEKEYIARMRRADEETAAYDKIPDDNPAKQQQQARLESFKDNPSLGALELKEIDKNHGHAGDEFSKALTKITDFNYKDPLGTGNTSYMARALKGTPGIAYIRAASYGLRNKNKIREQGAAWLNRDK